VSVVVVVVGGSSIANYENAYLHELDQNKFLNSFVIFFSDDVINPTPLVLSHPKSLLIVLHE
jgi:hypothetical protein